LHEQPVLDYLRNGLDEQRALGDELQRRALPPECDRQRGGDAVVVRGADRID
jgi:hypothetical protein